MIFYGNQDYYGAVITNSALKTVCIFLKYLTFH